MRLLFLTVGSELVASSRTRVFQYLPYFRRAGMECRVIQAYSDEFIAASMARPLTAADHARHKLRFAARVVELLSLAPRFDAVFIQKVLLPRPVLALLRRLNTRLVFDFDDAIYATFEAKPGLVRSWLVGGDAAKLVAMLKVSRLVLLENEYNRDYASRWARNIAIITGPIDTDRYRPAPRREATGKIVLGWIGSRSTAQYLEALRPVFKRLGERHDNIEVHLIGALETSFQGVTVQRLRWGLPSEVADLQRFDIGLMPLTDDQWTRGKGGYKILQYMAVGIPSVASPVGVNAELLTHGQTGFLASSEAEWVEALSALIEDGALRTRMGQAAREVAVGEHSFERHAPFLIEKLKASL